MDKHELLALREQLKISIDVIKVKIAASDEKVIPVYLDKYNSALVAFDSGCESDIIRRFNSIANCARGYMETSSHYQQEFLHEMGKTQVMVRKYLKFIKGNRKKIN